MCSLWFHFYVLWNLLGLALKPSIWWPILVNVPCPLKKNAFCSHWIQFVCMCVCVEKERIINIIYYTLYVTLNYLIMFMSCVKILIPTWNLCLLYLLIIEGSIFKSQIMTVNLSVSLFVSSENIVLAIYKFRPCAFY